MAIPQSINGVFPPPSILTTVLVTIAFYNVFELLVIIFTTFRPLCGLYFYSFLASTLGISIYLLGIILQTYRLSNEILLFSTLLIIGWIPMVTGQALVLYSRLRYLVPERKVITAVLAMVIMTGTIGHVPIVALVYGAVSAKSLPWALALITYEKVQVTLFFFQSVVMSGLYIWHALRMLRTGNSIGLEHSSRTTLIKLLCLSIIWTLLRLSIVIFEWKTPITTSSVYKATIYSVILKLEYRIFNEVPKALPLPALSSNIRRGDSEKGSQHELNGSEIRSTTRSRRTTLEPEVFVKLHTYNGKTQIISTAQFHAESDYPANEAYRSTLNDIITPAKNPKSRRSVVQHWTDDVDNSIDYEDDLDSFYGKSRTTLSELGGGTGLTPSPVLRKGSV